jgi:hypothetical protein
MKIKMFMLGICTFILLVRFSHDPNNIDFDTCHIEGQSARTIRRTCSYRFCITILLSRESFWLTFNQDFISTLPSWFVVDTLVKHLWVQMIVLTAPWTIALDVIHCSCWFDDRNLHVGYSELHTLGFLKNVTQKVIAYTCPYTCVLRRVSGSHIQIYSSNRQNRAFDIGSGFACHTVIQSKYRYLCSSVSHSPTTYIIKLRKKSNSVYLLAKS